MEYIKEYIDYLIKIIASVGEGSLLTLGMFASTLLLSLPLGLVLALGNLSNKGWLRGAIKGYILVMRGTPLMLQVYFVYFGIPIITSYLAQLFLRWFGTPVLPINGIVLEAFPSALAAFALNYAAYFAEIFRGGINSVDGGQLESARALGFSKLKAMRLIVLPQAFVNALPSISNETITLVKDTSLIYCIALQELLYMARIAVNRDLTLTPFVVAAVFYLAMTMVLTWLFNRVERSVNFKKIA